MSEQAAAKAALGTQPARTAPHRLNRRLASPPQADEIHPGDSQR